MLEYVYFENKKLLAVKSSVSFLKQDQSHYIFYKRNEYFEKCSEHTYFSVNMYNNVASFNA